MPEEKFQDLGRGRRKSQRRSFHYSARAQAPSGIQWDGVIIDISATGAQLEFIDTRDIPDEFSLLIGGQGAVKRACKVVWRSDDRLGVQFVRAPERLPTSPI